MVFVTEGAVYTGGLYWFPLACIGTLMGYTLIFGTILLSGTKLSRFKFVIAFTAVLLLTAAVFLVIGFLRVRKIRE